MQQWIAFYTNDNAGGADESNWCLCDTESDAQIAAEHYYNTLADFSYRIGFALVECPESWVKSQLANVYDLSDDEYFWPIPEITYFAPEQEEMLEV